MKNEWKKCFQIGVTLFLLFLCIYYWQPSVRIAGAALKAATPLLLGCVAAYIVNILMAFYQRHYFPNSKKPFVQKSARPVCITGAFLTLICIAVLVIRLIVPELTACIQLLLAEVPKAVKSIWDQIAQLGVLPAGIVQSLNSLDWNATLNNLLTLLKTGLGSTVQFAVGAVSSAASWLMNLVIGTIFAIYLLIDKERLQAQCLRVLARICRPAHLEKLRDVLSVVNRCFHRYIVGQCTEAVILGMGKTFPPKRCMIMSAKGATANMDGIKVGRFLAHLRQKAGWTQEQLGEKLSVTNKTVSRWKNGVSHS